MAFKLKRNLLCANSRPLPQCDGELQVVGCPSGDLASQTIAPNRQQRLRASPLHVGKVAKGLPHMKRIPEGCGENNA